ncbi:MAG: SPFH domain-containing protein [Clostridia bacterium]|nr:SPFH domain-containing protein [Clostridia bacterium]
MGIFDTIGNVVRSQLIDVIEWTDPTNDTIVHKYDMNGKEIMMGAQLTVRESQVAIFVNEGQLADIFEPGRYELQTSNMPILTALKSWKFGFNSPFKADVWFISTRQFLDCKWGTTNPVMMRDAEFGMIRMRAFGNYAFRVTSPETLLKEVFGTASVYKVSDIEGQIKRVVVSSLSDAVAESKIPALDIAANYDELAAYAIQTINPKLAGIGVQLTSFVIENVSLPEEVEKAMDRRTSMGVVGDLNKYTQYQAAEALRESASNPGGLAGAGVGMGAGVAMGQAFAQAMSANQQPTPAAPAAPAAASFCPACGNPVAAGAKFCANCGQKLSAAPACPACGTPVAADAKFCANCGQKL